MDEMEYLPHGLATHPAVMRRSSVFHDLITVFRKNTVARISRSTSDPHRYSRDNIVTQNVKSESDVFLGKADIKDKDADEDGQPLTRQALLERIRQKKEVIGKLRCQAWSMTRKKRTLKLAQKYLEQHESKVSRSHLYMEELRKRLRLLKRSFSNFKTYLIPWEGKIKRIESHFGSVVSSYFTFLRWIVFVNVIITFIIVAFVVLPEALADAAGDGGRRNRTETRKEIPKGERIHADELAVVWHYDGYLRYSPLFYGYYSDDEFLGQKVRYALPLAYFIVTLFIFAYSFFAILRKMAANARMSKLSGSKAEQYIFNWKVFTGWDYTIGNQETASNTVMAVVIKLRESVADCRVSASTQFRCLQFSLRVIANLVICAMLAFSIYCISFAVQKSQTAVEQEGNLFTKNQVPSVVATITHVFPMIFDLIGRLENYHPRTALRAHLTRVLVLYVLNYLTLIVALFDKMDAIRRKDPDSHTSQRKKRQVGGRNSYPPLSRTRALTHEIPEGNSRTKKIPRPPPFASRTFENRSQLLRFIEQSTQRFDGKKTTQIVLTTPLTVAPQFGPVNVNNPNAIMRSGKFQRPFETKRIGPNPLPIFTPPPRTHKQYQPGKVTQQFGGPDFQSTLGYTKRNYSVDMKLRSKTSPEITTKISPTRTELVNPDSTNAVIPVNNTLLGDKITVESASNSNETILLPEAAERKSSTDEMYNTDICWETIIGQEIVKLVTMDLIVTMVSILLIDFIRGLWIKYCSAWWCWDIETTFPEYGEFKVAENVLHIINNQGMIWLGLFFAPLLPALNNVKLVILMYFRSWAVMTCNVPAREIFRASRSSNFYLLILLLWLLLCTLPVGFVIASTRPSRSCGPFARHDHFYTVITNELEKRVDSTILGYIRHVASPGVVIPILLFLMLIIYFLVSLVRGLREANTDLQQQLIHERTEEKKKIFEIAGGRKKKPDFDRNKEKKKIIPYIPLIEQRRREPWRVYNELEQDPTRASDSSESEEEHQLESPDVVTQLTPIPVPTSTTVMQFHPSLTSLIENDEYENDESFHTQTAPLTIQSPPVKQIYAKGQLDSPSDSYDIQIHQTGVTTPEEVRIISPQDLYISQESRKEAHHIPLPHIDDQDKKQTMSVQSSQRQGTTRNGAKFDPYDIQPHFQPWPSIDEVRIRKERLMKRSPLPLVRETLPNTAIGMATKSFQIPSTSRTSAIKEELDSKTTVPIHRKYEQETPPGSSCPQSLTDDERRSSSPTRKFRISVSPTRKIQPDYDPSGKKRRFLIKQESITASQSSLKQDVKWDRSTNETTSPRAPRVEFGDDDSPRVQQ